MNDKGTCVLIVAKPGGPSEGLKALIETIPELAHVDHATDHQSALRVLNDCCPDLLLVNIEMPDNELEALVEYTKTTCPQCKCIVLVNDVIQQDCIRSANADAVEVIGIQAAKLAEIIQNQLAGEGGESP